MPPTKRLGTRTANVYHYIIKFKAEHDGVPPTIREIRDNTSHTSTSTVDYDLNKLEQAGLITRIRGGAIMVSNGRWQEPPNKDLVTGITMVRKATQ